MKEAGKVSLPALWVTPEQKDEIKRYIGGEALHVTDGSIRERESLELEIQQLKAELLTLQQELAHAKQKGTSKAKGVTRAPLCPSLPGRADVIAQALSEEAGKEKAVWKLEGSAKLVSRITTVVKTTATALEKVRTAALGQRAFETNASKGLLGGSVILFRSSLLTEEEAGALALAGTVLQHLATDVEAASHRVKALHKRRETEQQRREDAARGALLTGLGALNHEDQILLMLSLDPRSSMNWDIEAMVEKATQPEKAPHRTMKALHAAAKASAFKIMVPRIADKMQSQGVTADKAVGAYLGEFLSTTKRQAVASWGDLPKRIAAMLVADELTSATA